MIHEDDLNTLKQKNTIKMLEVYNLFKKPTD